MNFIKTYTSDWFCSYKAFISSRTCLSPSSWNIQNDIDPNSLIPPPSLQQYSFYTMFIFDLHALSKSNSPFTPTIMAISVGKDGEKLDPSYTADRNVKWYSTGKKSNGSSKNITILASNSTPSHILKRIKKHNLTKTCTQMFKTVLFIIAKKLNGRNKMAA